MGIYNIWCFAYVGILEMFTSVMTLIRSDIALGTGMLLNIDRVITGSCQFNESISDVIIHKCTLHK